MYNKLLGCCNSANQTEQGRTLQILLPEKRVPGATITTVTGAKSAQILSPQVHSQVQSPQVWRSTTIAQPIQVVFTYSNGPQYSRAFFGNSKPLEHQTSTTEKTSDMFSNRIQAPFRVPSQTNLIHRSSQSSTNNPSQKIMFGNQKPPPPKQVMATRQNHIPQYSSENHLVNKPQIKKIFQPAEVVYPATQKAFAPPIGQIREGTPSYLPTPIQNLQSIDGTNPSVELNRQVDFNTGHTQVTSNFPNANSNSYQQPYSFNIQKEQSKQDVKIVSKQSNKASNFSKVGRLNYQMVDQERNKSKSGSKNAKNVASNSASKKIGSANKKLSKAGSNKDLSNRLLEHRPCGRRHCVACELKRKEQAQQATKKK